VSHFENTEERGSSHDDVKCENVKEMEGIGIIGTSNIGLKGPA